MPQLQTFMPHLYEFLFSHIYLLLIFLFTWYLSLDFLTPKYIKVETHHYSPYKVTENQVILVSLRSKLFLTKALSWGFPSLSCKGGLAGIEPVTPKSPPNRDWFPEWTRRKKANWKQELLSSYVIRGFTFTLDQRCYSPNYSRQRGVPCETPPLVRMLVRRWAVPPASVAEMTSDCPVLPAWT